MPELLYLLVFLACPVAMGAVMWFMMRSINDGSPTPAVTVSAQPTLRTDAEVVAMRAELDRLHAELGHGRDTSASASPHR